MLKVLIHLLVLLVIFDKETQNFYEVLSVLCEQMKPNFVNLWQGKFERTNIVKNHNHILHPTQFF